MRAIAWTTASLLLASAGFGQTPASLSFEVATVKKAAAPGPGKPVFFGRRGGPGSDDPGRITWSNVNLRTLLMTAYDLKAYQINGPDWLDSERYEIVAKVAAGATNDQVNAMWRSLLAERFSVVLHHTSKLFQVEEMVPVKSGVKLKETTLDPSVADTPAPGAPPMVPRMMSVPLSLPDGAVTSGVIGAGPKAGTVRPFPGAPQMDKNGIPQLAKPGIAMMMTMGPNGPTARLVGRAQTLEQLAENLGNQLNRPVVDKTGLAGKYDFALEFAPDLGGRISPGMPGSGPGIGAVIGGPGPGDASRAPDAGEPSGVTLVAALQQQLGLRLVSNKAPLDVIVIDKAERVPTEN
jgi:uncharacterized protein (TIGR03435 family)